MLLRGKYSLQLAFFNPYLSFFLLYYKKIIASGGKVVYNVLNMIIMGIVPTEVIRGQWKHILTTAQQPHLAVKR